MANKYQSRFSPSEITAAQYLAEIMCERRARSLNRELPQGFWKFPEWAGFYKYQITLAYKLINEHGEKKVVKALQDPRTKQTFSLRSPFLRKIIDETSIATGKPPVAPKNPRFKRPTKPTPLDRLDEC